MKTIRYISMLIIAVIAGGWIVVRSLTIHVPVGYVGVRVQQYGVFGQKGVIEKDFGPGWHRDLGPIDQWELFDSTMQTLEMTRDPNSGSLKGVDDVKVTSADGYAVSLDVTVKFRVADGGANALYRDTGSGTKYLVIVRNEAQRACMGLFGQMTTEDFYNPQARRTKSDEVRVLLAQSLEDNFIEVFDVLIRDVVFDPEYENKIRRKKLADQEVELNKSMARAEEMSGKTQVIEAETEKLVQLVVKEKEAELVRMEAETQLEIAKIEAAYEKYVTELKADADLVAAQKDAEGERLMRVADAEGERLRNEALLGTGGNTLVALEAARNLNLSDVTVSTMETDLLDLERMADKLGVPREP
jgi:regulator of protease activity HflC (stomatin/prohibitin superfamily)